MTTKFISNIINDLEEFAYCEGFTLKLTKSTIFKHLDMCFAFVQSIISQTLEDLEDMESHYDCYDKSDWEDAQAAIDFADKMLCDLGILKDLGTSNYADESHHMDSLIILMKKVNSQLAARNEGSAEYNKYYLDKLVECITEICNIRVEKHA